MSIQSEPADFFEASVGGNVSGYGILMSSFPLEYNGATDNHVEVHNWRYSPDAEL